MVRRRDRDRVDVLPVEQSAEVPAFLRPPPGRPFHGRRRGAPVARIDIAHGDDRRLLRAEEGVQQDVPHPATADHAHLHAVVRSRHGASPHGRTG